MQEDLDRAVRAEYERDGLKATVANLTKEQGALQRSLLRADARIETLEPDLRRERERATKWEGLAASRRARVIALEAFLEKHEQWEVKLIQDRYPDGALDAMSGELYNATYALQHERNALLGRCGAKMRVSPAYDKARRELREYEWDKRGGKGHNARSTKMMDGGEAWDKSTH